MVSKKKSVFVAYQMAGSDIDSDGSTEEHAIEQKQKQKMKKKARAKKKNSDKATLKDLAMCSTAAKKKPTKAKAKGKGTETTASQLSSVDAAAVLEGPSEEKENGASHNNQHVKPRVPSQSPTSNGKSNDSTAPSTASKKNKQQKAKSQAVNTTLEMNDANALKPNQRSELQQPSSQELGAIYSPSHVKITRADGQVSRMIAVSEIMDQLVRFQDQNQKLLFTNHQLQERSLHDADMIGRLQNEVMMYRQMCLNLQADVTMLRGGSYANAPSTSDPTVPSNATRARCPPPPGIVQ